MNIASLKSRSRRTSVALLGAVALGAAVVPAASACAPSGATGGKLPVSTGKGSVTPPPPLKMQTLYGPVMVQMYPYGRSVGLHGD